MLVYLYTKPKNLHNKLRNQGVCVSNGTTNLVVVNNDRYCCICFTKSALTNRHC